MRYDVPCECGNVFTVAATDAGSQKACGCGRTVEVPTLRELRQAAGQSARVAPELAIRAMIHTGELPGERTCACCGAETADAVSVLAACERMATRTRNAPKGLIRLLGILTLGVVAEQMVNQMAADRAGDGDDGDKVLQLPVRVCPDCRPRLRGAVLREAVSKTPVYEQLLAKYPHTKLSFDPR